MSWLRKLCMTYCETKHGHTRYVPHQLLAYEDAITAIRSVASPRGDYSNVPIRDALGFALAQPILAITPNPRFDNSEVDGYAIGSESDRKSGTRLKLSGSIAAGEFSNTPIPPGNAIRILTGAPVPPHTYGIIMQEDVLASPKDIVLGADIAEGAHVRLKGADFGIGAELASVGTVVNASVAALLAFAGVPHPLVYSKPIVAVITTGDELVALDEEPSDGQIRDTNSVMLRAQVEEAIGSQPTLLRVGDNLADLKALLSEVSNVSDVMILSGGASVGDRDYLARAVSNLGTVYFHGVSIRPGKPFLFGKIGQCLVFGLPGNPASAFVCFELFVKSTLRQVAGWHDCELSWATAVTEFDHKAMGREDFVRVRWSDGHVTTAGVQGSFGIWSLALADGLARFPANEDVDKGSTCSVYWMR